MTTRKSLICGLIFGGACLMGSSNMMAQTFGLEYSTEWQTDFNGGYDWLNLLKASVQAPVTSNLAFGCTTISTAKTADAPLISDLQTYSNIEAGCIPLTFARLGFGISVGKAEWFAGIYNVNEDFFTSDITSFFTNSSCGISPTISCNFDIANYPLAACCVHYRQQLGDFALQSSIYPGQGYSRILGHDNLFTLNFKRDGIFSISSIDLQKNGIYCVLGTALHYGMHIGDEDGEPQASADCATQKSFSATPWVLSEIGLANGLGLHAHASYSTVKEGCKGYAGVGLTYAGKKVMPAAAFNYAYFTNASEYSVELGLRMPLNIEKAFVQPTLHLVGTEGESLKCIGMLRFQIEI